MFSGIEDGSVAQEWHTYLLQQAAQERLARRVVVHRRRPIQWFSAALIWLGLRLNRWGHHLQRRHQVVYEVTDVFRDPATWRPM